MNDHILTSFTRRWHEERPTLRELVAELDKADWDPDKHPKDEKGRFAEVAGGGEVRAFHGTSSIVLDSILKHGIRTGGKSRQYSGEHYAGDRANVVFVGNKRDTALEYAGNALSNAEHKQHYRYPKKGASKKEIASYYRSLPKQVVLEVRIPKNEWKRYKVDSWHTTAGAAAYSPKAIPPEWIASYKLYGYNEEGSYDVTEFKLKKEDGYETIWLVLETPSDEELDKAECGAGESGAPGFQEGNTCGGEEGGSAKTLLTSVKWKKDKEFWQNGEHHITIGEKKFTVFYDKQSYGWYELGLQREQDKTHGHLAGFVGFNRTEVEEKLRTLAMKKSESIEGDLCRGDDGKFESCGNPGIASAIEKENEIGRLKQEKGYAFDPVTGATTFSAHGVHNRIGFKSSELPSGSIFTHNHPAGGNLSVADVEVFLKHELGEMRAVHEDRKGNRSVYKMRFNKNDKQDLDTSLKATSEKWDKFKNKPGLERNKWLSLESAGLPHVEFMIEEKTVVKKSIIIHRFVKKWNPPRVTLRELIKEMELEKADWDEEDHPRDESGKFSEGDGSGFSEIELIDTWFEAETGSLLSMLEAGEDITYDAFGEKLSAEDKTKYKAMGQEIQNRAQKNSNYKQVWRGMSLSEKDIKDIFKHNKIWESPRLASGSTKREIADIYTADPIGNPDDPKIPVLLRIESVDGVRGWDRPESSFGEGVKRSEGEKGHEVVLPRGAKYRVVGKYKEGDTTIIRLYDKGVLNKAIRLNKSADIPSTPFRMEKARVRVESKFEPALTKIAEKIITGHKEKILAHFRKRFHLAKAKKGEKVRPPDVSISEGDLVDLLTIPIGEDLKRELKNVMKEGGNLQSSAFGVKFNDADPEVDKYLKKRKTNLEKVMKETTAKEVKRALAQGVKEGESEKDLIDRLEKLGIFDKSRAQRIARTEAHAAVMSGAHEAMKQNGVERRQWLAGVDDRVRDSHRDASGQIVGIDEPYQVGDAELMYPGDPDGPAEEVIHCRCSELVMRDELSSEDLARELDLLDDEGESLDVDDPLDEKVREAAEALGDETARINLEDVDQLVVDEGEDDEAEYDVDEGIAHIGPDARPKKIQEVLREHLVASSMTNVDARGFLNMVRTSKVPEPKTSSGTERTRAVRATTLAVNGKRRELEAFLEEKLTNKEWDIYQSIGRQFFIGGPRHAGLPARR